MEDDSKTQGKRRVRGQRVSEEEASSVPLRRDGWGENGTGTGRRRAEVEEKSRSWDEGSVEGENDLDLIPSLEDAVEEMDSEDITTKVADAPSTRARIQTLGELNKEDVFQLPKSQDGLDFSAFSAVLFSPEELGEKDEVWDHGLLFSSVMSEIEAEKDRNVVDLSS